MLSHMLGEKVFYFRLGYKWCIPATDWVRHFTKKKEIGNF